MQSFEELITEHIKYAKCLARQFYKEMEFSEYGLDDFESAALLGLCSAARNYQEGKETSFKTFSYLRIRGAIFDFLRRNDLSFNRNFRENNLKRVELLSEVDYSEIEISNQEELSPEEISIIASNSRFLQAKIKSLPHLEGEILERKYFKNQTFDEIQESYVDVSKSWLSRLHRRALDNLQRVIIADNLACESRVAEYGA